jgi:hypothetical protein
LPGKDRARFDGLSSEFVWASADKRDLESRDSFSGNPKTVAGLAAAVVLAVAVWAVLPRLARLVTLAGLVSDFSS